MGVRSLLGIRRIGGRGALPIRHFRPSGGNAAFAATARADVRDMLVSS
jgi:hypothetical protein